MQGFVKVTGRRPEESFAFIDGSSDGKKDK